MTFRKVPTKTEGLNTTRRAGDFLADNARPCLSDRCPTFADSKDYLTAYRDAGNEKELRTKKRRHAKRNAYRSTVSTLAIETEKTGSTCMDADKRK